MKNTTVAAGIILIIFFYLIAFDKPDDNKYLVLVNKTHQLPDDWISNIQLDTAKNASGEELQIERETCSQFLLLKNELQKQGIQIEPDSAYRSVEDQQALWDYFTETYSEEYARTYAAVPGYSEHHTGLAVDIYLIKDGKEIRENDDMLAEKEIFAKIHAIMPEYGFILRYPEGKEDITGYTYEPWHLRFVGSPKIAKEITVGNFTLEEYLGID